MKEIVAGGEPKGQPKLVPPPALGELPTFSTSRTRTLGVPLGPRCVRRLKVGPTIGIEDPSRK